MASIVFGVAGAVVGSFFGNPALGWAVGSAIGGALFPTNTTVKTQGPRLQDLTVQASTYGIMKPIIYGTFRLAGNVIDSSGLKEHVKVTKTKQGGKGGPTQTTKSTTYSYTLDIAIGLCEGPIEGIRKIWANGKLIFNASDTSTLPTILGSNKKTGAYKIYLGSETQLPDPTLEALHGVGNVPGYRGLAYIVFTDFLMDDYGQTPPNFTFEVVKDAVLSNGTYETAYLPTFGLNSFSGVTNYFSADVSYVWLPQWDSSYNQFPFTYKVYKVFNDQTFSYYRTVSTGIADNQAQPSSAKLDVIATVTQEIESGTSNTLHLTPVSGVKYALFLDHLTQGNQQSLKNGKYFYTANSQVANDPIHLFILPIQKALLGVLTVPTALLPSKNKAVTGYTFDFDILDSTLYRLRCSASSSPATSKIERYNATTLAYMSEVAGPVATTNVIRGLAVVNDSEFFVMDSSPDIYHYVDGAWEFVMHSPIEIGGPGQPMSMKYINGVLFLSTTDSTGNKQAWVAFDRLAQSATTVGAVIADLNERCGLEADEYDVSELTESLAGYGISSIATARAAEEPLLKYVFADAYESDGKIKYKVRGGAEVATVDYDDLGAHEFGSSNPEPFPLQRVQEVDLPRTVNVNYINSNFDYQTGSEISQRLITTSVNDQVENLAIAMSQTKAAQIASVLLYDAWSARSLRNLSLSRKYAHLDPADPILVEYPRDTFTRWRIIDSDYQGGVVNLKVVADEAEIYSPNAVGTTINTGQDEVDLLSITQPYFLDIPILQDSDDNPGLYVPMVGKEPWDGAVLFNSLDDISYTEQGSVFNSATAGQAITALGDYTGPVIFDEKNSVDVLLDGDGELSSSTNSALRRDLTLNMCAIAGEIIQFRDAELIDTNTYRLTGLLRGLKGTEQHISTHAIGDQFVLLTLAGTLRVNDGVSAIDQGRYYKAVSFGRSIDDELPEIFVNTGVGLMPLSPVHFGGGSDNLANMIFHWIARTRYDPTFNEYADLALGETTEAYEVVIYSDSSFDTELRTIEATTETATYTAVQQATDFGATQTTIYAKVFQISSVIGRGFGTELTVENNAIQGWTIKVSSFLSSNNILCVIYAGGQWLAVGGQSKCATSPNGTAWTQQTTGLSSANTATAIAYNGTNLYAMVNDSGGTNNLATSPDGVSWTLRAPGTGNSLRGIAHDQVGIWVAVGQVGNLVSSPDAVTWTARTSQFGSDTIRWVAHGNSLFVAVGDAGKISTSTNGTTWTARTSGIATVLRKVVYGAGVGLWVAVGESGIILTSADAITWTSRTNGFGGSTIILGISYGNSKFFASGQGGHLEISLDGIAWTQVVSFTANTVHHSAHDGTQWVAVANSAVLATTSSF